MLKGIDPRVTPELLDALARMGHGDVLAVVDRNYPAESSGRPVVRLAGVNLVTAVELVVGLVPLDQFVDRPVAGMSPTEAPDTTPEVQVEALAAASRVEGRAVQDERVERWAFYERARAAFAVVQTDEVRPYGCMLLAKGVL